MSVSKSIPKWQKELNSFKGIKSTFIIEGNVHDVYPYYDENNEKKEVDFFSLNRIIANVFNSGETNGFYDYLVCDPLFGFSDPLHFNKTPQLIDTLSKATENFNSEIRSFNKEDAVYIWEIGMLNFLFENNLIDEETRLTAWNIFVNFEASASP